MRFKLIYLTAFIAFLGYVLIGCSKTKEDIIPESFIEFGSGVDLKPVVGADGGSLSLNFKVSGDWSIDVNPGGQTIDWLNVSPTEGKAGSVTIKINVNPNETYDERNAAIVVRCGDKNETVTLTQKQKNALLVSSNKVEIAAEGGAFDIEYQSNINVSYEIEEEAKEWITVASSATRGLTTSTLKFQVAENDNINARQAVITLRGSEDPEQTEQITVYQAGSIPSILLSQKEYTVASVGETIKVELKSNVSYEIIMPDVSWIKTSSSRAISSYTHYFTVEENSTYDNRSAEIRFVNKDNNLEEKVTVIQIQKDAILLAQNEYKMSADGGSLSFVLQANVEIETTVSADWIVRQDAVSRGLTERKLIFNIQPNESSENREGTITLTGKSSDVKQVITVKQSKKIPVIIEGDKATIEMGNDADLVKDIIKEAAAQGVTNFIMKGKYGMLRLISDNPFKDITVKTLDLIGVTDWPDSKGLAKLPNNAFKGFKDIQSVILPSEIKIIGENAFAKCSNLKHIEALGVTKVEYAAFQGCNALKETILPEVEYLGRVSFSFSGLEKADFPKLTTLEGNVFWFCSSLTEVNLPEAIIIGEATDGNTSPRYGTSVFADCNKLYIVNLPKAVEIGDNAFSNCTSLQEINLPMAEKIGVSAFSGCKVITTIKLPKTKEILGNNNFTNCPLLSELYLTNPDDIYVNYNIFGSSSFSKNVNLYLNSNKKGEVKETNFGIEWKNEIWKNIYFVD